MCLADDTDPKEAQGSYYDGNTDLHEHVAK